MSGPVSLQSFLFRRAYKVIGVRKRVMSSQIIKTHLCVRLIGILFVAFGLSESLVGCQMRFATKAKSAPFDGALLVVPAFQQVVVVSVVFPRVSPFRRFVGLALARPVASEVTEVACLGHILARSCEVRSVFVAVGVTAEDFAFPFQHVLACQDEDAMFISFVFIVVSATAEATELSRFVDERISRCDRGCGRRGDGSSRRRAPKVLVRPAGTRRLF